MALGTGRREEKSSSPVISCMSVGLVVAVVVVVVVVTSTCRGCGNRGHKTKRERVERVSGRGGRPVDRDRPIGLEAAATREATGLLGTRPAPPRRRRARAVHTTVGHGGPPRETVCEMTVGVPATFAEATSASPGVSSKASTNVAARLGGTWARGWVGS